MPQERDPNQAVDALVGAIQNLASDDNYKAIADVFRDAQNLRIENARLTSSTRDMLEEYRHFRNDLEVTEVKLQDEKAQLQHCIEQRDSEIQGLEDDKVKLDTEVEKGRQMLNEESQKCQELLEKKEDLEQVITNLEGALDEESKLIAELEEAKSKLDTELGESKESLGLKAKELVNLESAKTKVESQLLETRASLDDRTKALASVEEEKATVEDQLTEVNARLVDKTKEAEVLAATEQALTIELAEVHGKLSEKEKEFDELSEVKASLEHQLAEVTSNLEEKNQELDGLSVAKEKLETDLNDICTNLADQFGEAEALTLLLTETNTKLDNKTKEAEDLRSQLGDVDARLEAKSREIFELSEAKSAVDTKLTEVNDQLSAEQEVNKAVEEELLITKDSLHQEVDRANNLSDEVSNLHQDLQDRNDEIDHLKEGVAEGKDNFAQAQLTIRQLENITHELDKELKAKKASLDEIDGYRVKLKDEPEDSCVEILDTIWVSVLDLAEKHFSADLDDTVLRDSSCWTNLRSSDYLKHAVRIPLPPSNTTVAKQMRIAAVLAVLSRALTKHIFRPTYLIENDAELTRALKDLEADNPAQELHARSTLLAILPDREKRNAARRVKSVVREVSYLVQHLLSALQYEAFCTALEASCELACRQWRRIQGATMKVEPYFGPPYDDYDWQVLLLPERFGPGGPGGTFSSGSTLGLDAGSGTIGGGVRLQDDSGYLPRDGGDDGGGGDETSTIAESVRSVVDPADIMLVLWPSMCAVEGGELVSITQGLVMAKEQASAAFDEEGRRRPWLSHKRARSMSQSRRSSVGSPRSAARPFLAHPRTEGDVGGASASSSHSGSAAAPDGRE